MASHLVMKMQTDTMTHYKIMNRKQQVKEETSQIAKQFLLINQTDWQWMKDSGEFVYHRHAQICLHNDIASYD